jgi:predicted amidohydrolase
VPTHIAVAANATRYRVDVRPLDRGFVRALERGIVGVATTSFKDGATIEWQRGELGDRAIALRGGDDRAGRLWDAIQAAALGDVDVLVAPELTVPPGMRDGIADRLRWSDGEEATPPSFLVLGSFHEQREGRFVNCARLLDGATGNALLEHHKLVQYGVHDGFVEGIQLGDSITVLATPIGTVAIAICKDFCDYHVGPIWHQIQPDWLLVPAYGRGGEAHALSIKAIRNMLGTVVVLAHQGDAAIGAPFKSFIDDPLGRTPTDCDAPGIMSRKILI